jgi:hypothetical protein
MKREKFKAYAVLITYLFLPSIFLFLSASLLIYSLKNSTFARTQHSSTAQEKTNHVIGTGTYLVHCKDCTASLTMIRDGCPAESNQLVNINGTNYDISSTAIFTSSTTSDIWLIAVAGNTTSGCLFENQFEVSLSENSTVTQLR